MKKIIALILSVVMICCFSVTAFAADSPVATEKVTVTVRKADVTDPTGKEDVEYTLDHGDTITVKASDTYGTFNDWTIYKVEATVEGTVSSVNNSGIVTLSAVKTLAATTKTSVAVEGTDYEIVKGSLTSEELTIKAKTSVIICGNYDNVKTDPLKASSTDDSDSAPKTGDVMMVYAVVVMLGIAAFGFGVKKVYSK